MDLPVDRAAIVGILNVTPDSFSDGGAWLHPTLAWEQGVRIRDAGADIVDVGGESTRPGATPVPELEEMDRVLPVIERLVKEGVCVSVDTTKVRVAAEALALGAKIVNDVSGGNDPAMRELVVRERATYCIMHTQGDPTIMQDKPTYEDVVDEVKGYLLARGIDLLHAGLSKHQVWIDPGIGFGKTTAHNLQILKNIETFVETGFPVMIGLSRKSFLGRVLGSETEPADLEERIPPGLWIQGRCEELGVRLLRVHDVSEAIAVSRLVTAFRSS